MLRVHSNTKNMATKFSAQDRRRFVEAALAGNQDTVASFLADGMPADTASPEGTALFAAAVGGSSQVMQLLVQAGCNVNLRLPPKSDSGNYGTALHGAIERRKIDAAIWLLDHGANPRALSGNGYTAAHRLLSATGRIATSDEDFDAIAQLLVRMLDMGVPINQRGGTGAGTTLLHTALSVYDVPDEYIHLLLDRGADMNAISEAGMLPIHHASMSERPSKFAVLVSRGADINARDAAGRTPLHLVNNETIADTLLSLGADLELQDNEGRTPLAHHLAKLELPDRVPRVVARLVESMADLDTADYAGVTPRHIIQAKKIPSLQSALASIEARRAMKGVMKSKSVARLGR
jgi:ankyrin repeat protein